MTDRRMALAALAAVLSTCASAGAAGAFEVPLTLREPAGVARKSEPISGGVPLPKGRFRADQPFALVRADGTELPCQVSPLVIETDGTLRWVLLDFQDDVAARQRRHYVLRAGPPRTKPPRTLTVHRTQAAVTIDTGRARLAISRTRPFGLFESVAVGGRKVVTGGAVAYTQFHGRKGWDDANAWRQRVLHAGPPETVRLHHAGPLRVTVEVAGHFRDDPLGMGYKAFITTWAGSSRAQVKYKLCNSHPAQYTLIPVRQARLELKLAGGGKGEVLIGAGKPVVAADAGWLHQGLEMRAGAGAARAGGPGPEDLWRSAGPADAPGGWIASTGDASVFVCDRLFATNPPRRLAVEGGKLVLEPIATAFEAPKDRRGRPVGAPHTAEGSWLFDCTHHSSEYLFDFDAAADAEALDAAARAFRRRRWFLAPPGSYRACEAVGTGHFGTLADEIACYRTWGWKFTDRQRPQAPQVGGDAFVAWEDNHYESEADSVEGLLLMYLRTGERGWFDLAEAWARYHVDLQVWRTDGWRWKDGAIWFPQGGPQGNRPVRRKWNFAWGPNWGGRKDSRDCRDLWRHCMAKSCYCHYYGAGIVDFFCLTGEPDALAAAIDNVETKDSEFRRHQQFVPGKTPVGSIRGFGRGFQVILRTLEACPDNEFVADLAQLCARTLWQSPLLDERGFHGTGEGAAHGMRIKDLSPPILRWMRERGITFTQRGGQVDTLTQAGRTWTTHNYGGTWQHVYIQNGAERYARHFDDDDMRDVTIAFAQMSAKYMRSRKCHQTWYYTYFDVPARGQVFDPWVFDHADTTDGVGCVHSGYYTRHYPDACAKGYSLTGERHLLEEARRFWYYGSKRRYRTKGYVGGKDEIGKFAGHRPPKDDDVLAVSRLLYEAAHPRPDARAPAAVTDLRVKLLGGGKAEVRFRAPRDAGGGRVVRYQVKAAALPILPYEQWDYARDVGKKRNWWRAVNLRGEPAPRSPAAAERFVVTGVPDAPAGKLHFAARSFDDSHNRSAISNLARP